MKIHYQSSYCRIITHSFSVFILLLWSNVSIAQTLSLDKDFLTDYVRNRQLADTAAPDYSFCVRPLTADNSIASIPLYRKLDAHFSILPLSLSLQTNSHNPFTWNNGAMIPAVGPQAVISGGIYASFGRFTLQVQPEILYAQNQSFETFPTEYAGVAWQSYYMVLNNIDNPEQFGSQPYKKAYPGQSSLYYHPKNLALGISTENIWWGPGIQNSLVMSNNAPGFLHADIHTTVPIKTAVGSFEFQLLGGKLENSNIDPPNTNVVYNGNFLYQPKITSSRYLSGITVSWQPKWARGLFVGFSQASYLYKKDISGIADILPLQGILTSKAEKENKKATLGSVFMRYIFSEEHAEFYLEYGRNDRSADIINLITDNKYPRAFVAGFKKLANLSPDKSRLEFSAEIADLGLPTQNLINTPGKSWYTNTYVRQGYTNMGRVIGAGIGPGGNSQMMDISWIKGFTKIGIQLERVLHNNDFYYNLFSQTGEYQRHWVDLSTDFHAIWKIKNILVKADMGLSRSLNYEWWVLPNSVYFTNGDDYLNFHGALSIHYGF